jgi:hypothetical protein
LIEFAMIQNGGYFKETGHGLFYHYKQAISLLWPDFWWHGWSDLLIKSWVEHKEIGVMGPASSGKTYCAAALALCTYWVWPIGTSVVMSTTTKEGLQNRIWGAIKSLYNSAKRARPDLHGDIIESSCRIITPGEDDDEARDYRNGIMGVACRVGGHYVGLSNYVGLKNDRVFLIADEASLMGRGFYDSLSNLRKNPSFKLIAMGNPSDRHDTLGLICEPHPEIGGWEGVGYVEKTRTWKTRGTDSLAIQLCGYDSPNYEHPRGLNPFPGLITPEQIESDEQRYGKDSINFQMMNLGILPKDGGSKRVITLSLCEQNKAFEKPIWADKPLTHILGLDPAYSGAGGDRTVLTHLVFGIDKDGKQLLSFENQQIVIPIRIGIQPEEQIASFVKDYAERYSIPPGNVGFDSTGRGSLMAAFAKSWSPEVVPIEFGGLPTDRIASAKSNQMESEIYGKMVTALWYSSRMAIESGQVRNIHMSTVEEGMCRSWRVKNNGKIDVEPKEDTKERMGRSPDLWDSFVVAIEVARRRGFEIDSVNLFGLKRKPIPDWMKRLRERSHKFTMNHELSPATA